MNKIAMISHVLSKIDANFRNIDKSEGAIFQSISDYIKAVSYLNSIITIGLDDRRKNLEFADFGFTVHIQTKLKIYDLDARPSYCNEIEFYIEENRHDRNTVLKIFVTEDGFIVQDVYSDSSICQTENPYKGKNIVELLLMKLVEKNIMSL